MIQSLESGRARRARVRVLLPLSAALFASALATAAFAQSTTSDKAAAEALFDEGKKLMIAGQFPDACDKLEQSQRVDPGIGTLLYLAECYEKSGRTASAWATFREATSAARAAGQADRARQGQQRADRLEANLSKLTIAVPEEVGSLPGFELRRGTELIPKPLWNIPVPVDPGEHQIDARAPGRKPYVTRVRVAEQAGRASISIPPLEISPDGAAVPPPPGQPETQPPGAPASAVSEGVNPPPADIPPSDGSTQRTLAFVAGGVGIVGIGVGTFFGLRAIKKNKDAEKFCEGTRCTADAESLTDQAKSSALVSDIGIGVGAAALITGAVLYFTLPKSAPSAKRMRLTPLANSHGGGMFLSGAF
jgi:serine/threonine-protein kinase